MLNDVAKASPDAHRWPNLCLSSDGVAGVHLRRRPVVEGRQLRLEWPARLGLGGVEDWHHRPKVSVRFQQLHVHRVLGAQGRPVDRLVDCLAGPLGCLALHLAFRLLHLASRGGRLETSVEA